MLCSRLGYTWQLGIHPRIFFPRVRTLCGHGAQIIVEREEQSDGGERNEDPKTNQTKHPSPQAETPPSCSLSSALGETCSGCNHRPNVCEDLSSNPWKRPFLQHNPFNWWRIQDQSHAARQDSNLAAIPSERSLQLRVNRAQLPRGEADPTPFGTQRCQ